MNKNKKQNNKSVVCSSKGTVSKRTALQPTGSDLGTLVITPTYGGMPPSRNVTMTYVDGNTIHAGAGTGLYSYWSYRANSLYDPDQTGTGHQPMGRDQWALFYTYYVVTEAEIAVTFTPQSVSTFPLEVGILLHEDGSTLGPNLASICEQGRSKRKSILGSFGCVPVQVTHSFNAASWFGIKDVTAARSSIGAIMSANPSDLADFVVYAGSFFGTSPEVYASVSITYKAHLTEPVELTGS